MPRRKPTREDLLERERRATEWTIFRRNHLLTQRWMAQALGISRRTLQQIEAGNITPHESTLHKFDVYRKRFDRRPVN